MPNRLKEKLNGGDSKFITKVGLAGTGLLEAAKSYIAKIA
jgi:hypothetical protein